MTNQNTKKWIIGISVFLLLAAGVSAIAYWHSTGQRYRPETAGQGYGAQGGAFAAAGEGAGAGAAPGGGRGAGRYAAMGTAGAVTASGNDPFYLEMEQLFDAVPAGEISAAEAEALIFMWNEEKLARDVYAALAVSWNMPVFSNISASENQHLDSVAYLLERYGIDLPGSDSAGSFADPAFLSLYNDLVDQGRASLSAAFEVGATIEDLDIADLQERLGETDNEDIALLYQNLMKGSRNHMRSFVRLLERQGGEYEAQFIDADYLDTILSYNQEMAVITDPDYRF
jgi:hypothetical protein